MSFNLTITSRVALAVFLLGTAAVSVADEGGAAKSGLDWLMDMYPKPHEIELARQGLAEAKIEKPWERSCPYRELSGTAEQEDEFFYRCKRWDDCTSISGVASIYSEAYFQNHQREPQQQVPWELFRDGSIFLLEAHDFEGITGHLRQHALKSAGDTWQFFEGRAPVEASDMVEATYWQWCSAEPLTLWKAEYE
ncbi:hypothetical protein [Shewanella sp. GXUN23E]|uniref:hypothetical protein n=1 Tax=Shewanella sp. GXUN23E TaxID=3422498 RepID=UPI003D7D959B